jgi:hypothetical protein
MNLSDVPLPTARPTRLPRRNHKSRNVGRDSTYQLVGDPVLAQVVGGTAIRVFAVSEVVLIELALRKGAPRARCFWSYDNSARRSSACTGIGSGGPS